MATKIPQLTTQEIKAIDRSVEQYSDLFVAAGIAATINSVSQ